MIKILLIDNDKNVSDSLCDTANRFDLELEHYQGLEEGFSELQSRPYEYSGIILDGRGWLSEDRPTEKDSHVHMAFERLKDLRLSNIFIPHVVYTGYFERIYEQIPESDSHLIFDKTKGAEPMLKKLKELINNSGHQKLKLKYPEAFSPFGEKYLPLQSQSKMLQLLEWYEEDSLNQNYFNTIRDLIEEMLKKANAIDPVNFLPDSLIRPTQNGRPNLKASELYLTGRLVDLAKLGCGDNKIQAPSAIFPDHIGWLFSSLSNNTQILSHNYSNSFTTYAFKSSVFALIEILFWFKKYIDTNYPKET